MPMKQRELHKQDTFPSISYDRHKSETGFVLHETYRKTDQHSLDMMFNIGNNKITSA